MCVIPNALRDLCQGSRIPRRLGMTDALPFSRSPYETVGGQSRRYETNRATVLNAGVQQPSVFTTDAFFFA